MSKKLHKNENLECFSGKNCFFAAFEREWKTSKKIIFPRKTGFLETLLEE
jgi:hypothetical protein